ncbi:MAG: hypothetical protein IPK76_02405 [Lewinellaceae bacterium]|nr:hypothetical protein [Lewinellaceae bacterium]
MYGFVLFAENEKRVSPKLTKNQMLRNKHLPLPNGKWAYLATWMDLFSRLIVGWTISLSLSAELIGRPAILKRPATSKTATRLDH